MAVPKPLKIGVFGLDERARKLIELFFAGPCKGRFVVVSQFQADVLIVDLDRPSGWTYYQTQSRVNPQRPLVAISLYRDREEEVDFFIKKPMRLETVLEVLEKAALRLREGEKEEERKESTVSQTAATAALQAKARPERRMASPAQNPLDTAEENQFLQLLRRQPEVDLVQVKAASDLFYDPEGCIQGHLQKAIALAREQKQGMRVTGFWGHLYIDPIEERAYSEILDSRLRPMTVMRIPTRDIEIEPIEDALIQDLRGKKIDSIKSTSGIEALLWNLSLWSSRGRLPVGTEIESPVFLRRWPNFTRILETPNAMRITALWGRQPASLGDTLEALRIPQAELFSFFSAALATGCVGIGRRQADSLISPVPLEPTPQRSLFKRVLGHLFRPNGESQD